MRGFDSSSTPDFCGSSIDWARIRYWFDLVFKEAYRNFDEQTRDKKDFADYCENQKHWLNEFAHYQALRRYYRGHPWWTWPEDVARRTPLGLDTSRKYLRHEITREKFVQFSFDRHWQHLKQYARSRGVGLIGTLSAMPMNDSADVWADPLLFEVEVKSLVDSHMRLSRSNIGNERATLQRVQPRWDVHRANGFAWWLNRFRRRREHFDILRFGDAFVSVVPQGAELFAGRAIADVVGDRAHCEILETLSEEIGELRALAEGHEIARSTLANGCPRTVDDAWAGRASIALASFQSVQRTVGADDEAASSGTCSVNRRIDQGTFGPLLAQRLANVTTQHRRNPH